MREPWAESVTGALPSPLPRNAAFSATRVFAKDIGNVIQLVVRLGFWFTPIFWRIDMFPDKYHLLLKANPAYYLVTGYRQSLFSQGWFWNRGGESLYFWSFTIAALALGFTVFRRLKPHFTDVL